MLYPSTSQSQGESISKNPDIPLGAVFLVLFLIPMIISPIIFIRNRKRGILFVFNMMIFGISILRVITFSLRIAWANDPKNINLALSANIFTYAGTIILYIANLFFAERIIRAQHPNFGWHRVVTLVRPAFMALTIVSFILLFSTTIDSFTTTNAHVRKIDRGFQLFALSAFILVAFVPTVAVSASYIMSRFSPASHASGAKVDHFGRRPGAVPLSYKAALVIVSSVLLTLGIAFRAQGTYRTPTPLYYPDGTHTPWRWYYSKACFYTFNFCTELAVIYSWLGFRVDRLFVLRNGAKGGWSYSVEAPVEDKQEKAKESGGYTSDEV